MAEIGIVGSGNVGANTAFFIAEKGIADVVLHDVKEGLGTGKALDMMEAAPIRGYRTTIAGASSLDEVKAAEIIIIAAGVVRHPGMRREDLFDQNRTIISEIAGELADTAAKVVVATEPVDLLTTHFVRESGLPGKRVIGLGSALDAARMRYLLAKELGVTTENVSAMVIGRHSDDMIPLARYSTISGVPVDQILAPERIQAVFAETRSAGSLIVEMAQRASAYYAPSAVAADLAEAIHRNSRRVIPVSLTFTGQYGIEGVAMGLPAVIGSGGIEEVLEPRLTDEEQQKLRESAAFIERVVGA